MKKIVLLLLLAVVMTGCTNKYKTVGEFEQQMDKIKDANTNYTIEGRVVSGDQISYYKYSVLNNQWRSDYSTNGGSTYLTSTINNGVEIYKYETSAKYAIVFPKFKNRSQKDSIMLIENPMRLLREWRNPIAASNVEKSEFINQDEYKNGYKCRMIRYTSYETNDSREVCVNDENGLAVYYKANIGPEKKETELTLAKYTPGEVQESEFELPEGMKKYSYEQAVTMLSDAFKSLSEVFGN